MSVDDIVEDLKSQITLESKGEMNIKCPEFMRLTYPLYAITKKKDIKFFSYGVGKFEVSLKTENDIVTDISVSPAETWDNSNLVKIDGLDIEETIRWCLSEFSTCINMAALWDKNNT